MLPPRTSGKRAVERGPALRNVTKWRAAPPSPSSMPPAGPARDHTIVERRGGKCLDLVSNVATHFITDRFHQLVVTISIDIESQTDVLVVGDSSRGPLELFVLPEVVPATPGEPLTITITCLHVPYFLPGGMWVARAIPLPDENLRTRHIPSIYWTEIVGANRPTLACKLTNGGSHCPPPRDDRSRGGRDCHCTV